MPIRFILLYVLFIFPVTAFSQLTWGFKAGVNLNTIHVTQEDYFLENFGIQRGFHAGLYGFRELAPQSALGAELLFSQRGFKYAGAKHAINYLTVPLYYSHKLSPKFSVQGGGSFSLLLAYRIDTYKQEGYASDASISLLAGFRYIINPNWSLSARYYHALSPFLDDEYSDAGGTVTDRVRYFTRTIEIGIGFEVL